MIILNENNFALELLQEIKAQSRRWFVAFCVMVCIECATIIGFLWYISLPTEESSTTQSVEDIESGDIMQIGGDNHESDTDNSKSEKSHQK